jgi:archaellum component FlaF (FlaF/FlaG flagellin family)
MFSAALSLGCAVSSYAAPLALKATAHQREQMGYATTINGHDSNSIANRLLRQHSSNTQIKEAFNYNSKLKAQNHRAIKSATSARRREVAESVNLVGSVSYTDNYDMDFGVYKLPTNDEQDFVLYGPTNLRAMTGYEDGQGHYIAYYVENYYGTINASSIYIYDTTDWSLISSKDVPSNMQAFDIALDPTTGDVYGCYYNDALNGVVWGKGDYTNGQREAIADLDVILMTVVCDKNGQYYALGEDNVLYKVTKETGELEEIASDIDIDMYYNQSGAFNNQNNTILTTYNNYDDEGGLVEINVATGEATNLTVFPYGEQIVGVYIVAAAADDKAPAAPELTATCENGSHSVTLAVTLPTTLFDGTPVSGDAFSFSVTDDKDNVVFEGSGVAGSTQTTTITINETGNVTFTATASNGVGSSPKVKANVFVGLGSPAAPQNVNLAWADGTATLTWNAVTESADGGYINPAEVTYTVLDADGSLLAEGITTTTFTKAVAAPNNKFATIQYSVKAVCNSIESAATASNVVGLGGYTVPCNFDLVDSDVFNEHSIIDDNNDGRTWEACENGARYHYSGLNSGDDWLISPGLKLEAGKAYVFTAMVKCERDIYPERIAIFYGSDATVSAMTNEIVGTTVITSTTAIPLTGAITPETDGTYYIGFHALSDKNMYYLTVESYSVDAPTALTAPGAVTNATVAGDPSGDLNAIVSFDNPTVDLAGNAFTGDVTVKVYRNETLVKELTGAAGSHQSFSDPVSEAGTYTYTLVTYNSNGDEGLSVNASGYVGPKTPAAPANRVAYETNVLGTYHISWDAVTTAEDGSAILPSNVTYNVYSTISDASGISLGEKLNSEPITATEFTAVMTPETTQTFVYFAIQAVNRDADGDGYLTNPTAAGPAYTLPATMSANDADFDKYILAINTSDSNSTVSIKSDAYITSADNDDASFCMYGSTAYSWCKLITGKMDLNVENPVVKFYNFKVSDQDVNMVTVSVLINGEEIEVEEIDRDDMEAQNWNEVKVDLSEYQGQSVQLVFTTTAVNYYYSFIDAIKVCDDLDYDLAAKAISAPSQVTTDYAFDIDVTVTNEGAEDCDSYTIDLLRDGEIVATKEGSKLPASKSDVITFKQALGVNCESATFQAVVTFIDDQYTDNNKTDEVTVTRKASTSPTVTGLTGEATADGNVLTWDPIVVSEPSPVEVLDTFEDREPWATELDDWTFVDEDQAYVGGFQFGDVPGMTVGESYASFFVFDCTDTNVVGSYASMFTAHSGKQYLASLFRADDGENSDWAISPELPGTAQTISFYARSLHASFPEKIEVYYSTSNTELGSFQIIESATVEEVPATWDEYTVDLPEGTRYFAIRSCATGAYMLLVDDVTYTKIDGFNGKLLGYNIYCDGVKVNDALVTEATYTHVPADNDAHTYTVTAVYDLGESEFSDGFLVAPSGVDIVTGSRLSIRAEGHAIIVNGAEGKKVIINAVDGKTLYNANGNARVEVLPGIYLVTVNNQTTKLIVR